MAEALNHRDLLLCVVARERGVLDDASLQQAVEHWLETPRRSLAEVIAERKLLSASQLAELSAAADSRAAETCLDPVGSHLRSLPRPVRSLLQSNTSASRRYETTPSGDRRSAAEPVATAALSAEDRFSIEQLHAQGGLGVVYQARDAEIDRVVALKQIKSQWADDAESRTRFILEAKITGRLEHPGIVPIYALGTDQTGRPYYAMRLIRGESLLNVIERFHKTFATVRVDKAQRILQLRKLLGRFVDVCNALEYAHSHGIVHRDVKPANVMLGKFGETLVVDWGLAKVIGADEEAPPTSHMDWTPLDDADDASTRVGSAVGTPAYMSPEQAAGRLDEIGPASDVYSLGATLYQLLTGALPHEDEQDLGVLMAQIDEGQIIAAEERAPWLPRPLTAICRRALATNPAERYRSARALADDVERWLADEPVDAHRETLAERTFRWMRNHRTLVISLVAAQLVAAAAAAAGVIGWNHFQARRRADEAAIAQERRERQLQLAAAASSAAQSAAAELAASRFQSALGFLDTAVETLAEQPDAADALSAATARRDRVASLVEYRRQSRRAEELIAFQYDTAARRELVAALDRLGVFEHGDWWARLPMRDLTPEQADQLQRDVYRQLILLAANYAKGAFGDMTGPGGAEAARNTLAVAERVLRFRPAASTSWHAAAARLRLGQGAPRRLAQLPPPQNAADAYMLGALSVIASQNPAVAALLTADADGLLDDARRYLLLSSALEPQYYWTHFVLGYLEMLAAGEPAETPPAESRPHYQDARRAFSQAIAIEPDYWLAYAERSNSYRQEIESRRAAGLVDQTIDGETAEHLREMMLRDMQTMRNLGAGVPQVAWYEGFALYTAGRIDSAIDALLAALQQGARFDVDGDLRMIDPETQRALPETLQIADALLADKPDERQYLLLRATVYWRLQQFDAALADVLEVLDGDDPPALAHVIRGLVRLRRDETAKAKRDFQEALTVDPQHVVAKIGLAGVYETLGDYPRAAAIYDQSLPSAQTPWQTPAMQLGRGRALLVAGKPDDALAAIGAARRAEPSCSAESIRRLAKQRGDEAFLDRLNHFVREPTIVERDAADRPAYDMLPVLGGDFELPLGVHWNNLAGGAAAWRNVDLCQSTAEVVSDPVRRSRVLRMALDRSSQGYGETTQTVPADPRMRYRATLWAKAESLAPGAARIVLGDQRDAPRVQLPPGTYDWRELTAEFSLPARKSTDAAGIVPLTIRIQLAGAGEARLDDLQIEAAGERNARTEPAASSNK